MVDLLSKLKQILKIEINIDKSTHIHLDNSFNETHQINKSNKELLINPISEELESNQKKKLQDWLKEFLSIKGNRVLESKIPKILENISNYLNSDSQNEGLINFFKPLMKEEDYEVFESSYFIVSDYNSSYEIPNLKKGIRKEYGSRGVRIVNLVSAGYFSFLADLYTEDKELYESTYEHLLSGLMTIFVHNETNIYEEAKNKIERLRKYKLKLKFLHIHGKNLTNVQKISEFIEEEKEFKRLNVQIKPLLEKRTLMVVELYPN